MSQLSLYGSEKDMNKKIEKNFVLGGSIEKALSGNYELRVGSVLQEAWKFTLKNFLSFSPAIVILLAVQLAIFFIAMKLQLGDPLIFLHMFENPELMEQGIFDAIFIANFSYEVISAPIYAGVSLMAMSHAAGLLTKPQHILKGLQFTVPVIVATLFSLVLQWVGGMLIPLLSMYFSVAFSNSILLICEKRVSPLQSLWLSFRAVNRKLFPIVGLYIIMTMLLFISIVTYGIFLIVVLPFFFHVKGIIYRNMFGITLKLVTTNQQDGDDEDKDDSGHSEDSSDTDSHQKGSQTFDA